MVVEKRFGGYAIKDMSGKRPYIVKLLGMDALIVPTKKRDMVMILGRNIPSLLSNGTLKRMDN